jgi:hypothetical protein
MLIAAPAAALGVVAGALATYGPVDRLLTLLNEPAPGTALAAPLAAAWATAVALPALGAAWPAWRAGGIPVVGLLRGADVAGGAGGRMVGEAGGRARRHFSLGGRGLTTLGVRLAGARRTRMLLTALTLGVSTAFVLLMLALAGALHSLQTDPGALGKRYQLTAALPPSSTRAVRVLGGVAAVAPRYEVQAADSFSLGESIDVVAFAGDHTTYEAPPLVSGRRLRGSHQAEVGAGLADALGLRAGATLALALPSGRELRLRVSGIVSSLAHDGRVAYVPASALLAADPFAPSQLAIRLPASANQTRVSDELQALGAQPAAATGATERGAPLVYTLRAIVIAVAVVDGLVCLYALIQACALTVQERRRTIAVLRAGGAGPRAVRQLLTGAVLALAVPALLLGVLLERLVFGPALARLAAGYATLPLGLSVAEAVATVAGVLAAGTVAVVWVARQAGREPVVRGLSG